MIQFLKTGQVKPTTQSTSPHAPGRTQARRIGNLLAALLLFGLSFSSQAQIALRGTSSAISTSASVTVNRPTGVVSGDLMIANIGNHINATQSSATCSGWTLVAGTNVDRGRASLLYKIAGSSEPASYTFTVTASSSHAVGAIVAFSGVSNTNPFDVALPTNWTTSAVTSLSSVPSVTTVTNNSAIVLFGNVSRVTSTTNANYVNANWTTATFGALTELFDVGHNNVGSTPAIGAAWAINPTPGASGNGSLNCVVNTSPRTLAGIMLALRPACPDPNTAGTASSTPTLCLNTALTNITHTTTGATGIANAGTAGANGLPAGVSAAFASNTITISGTPTASGTFNYSIPLTGGCGTVNATGTITVLNGTIDYANLQFPGSQTICAGNNLTAFGRIYEAGVTEAAGANSIIEAQVGFNATNTNPNTWAAGNWTNASYNVQSGNDDEYSGSFGSALAAGTYYYAFRYRMNGCAWQYGGFSGTGGGFYNGSTNNNGVLTVSPSNTAGTASSTPTLCINTALTNITHTTTGATGIGTATGLPAGVSPSFASNTITISGTPSASGTFNYSIPLTGGCGSVNATGTITVTPANTISLSSAAGTNAQLNCINAAITNITYSTTGASGASFSGLPPGVNGSWASNVVTISGTPTSYGFYNYTITLTGGCGTVTANGSLNVNGLDYANLQFPGTQTICPGSNFTAYGQVFEPGITEAAGANANIEAQFGYHTSNTDPSTWPAGNWSATTYSTQSGNNDEYRIDFGSALASGTYYYTFRYRINGCSWQYGGAFSGFWNGTTQPSGVLTVSPISTSGTASSNPTLCINTALTSITHTTTGATGISNAGTAGANGLPAGVAASWNSNTITIFGTPSASGTFNYSIPLTGGCGTVNATGTITVTAAPNAGTLSGTQTICAAGTTTFSSNGNAGGAWTSSATGIATVNGSTGVVTGVAAGTATITYTVTGTGGCSNATATRTVTVTAAPNAGTLSGTQNICVAGTTTFSSNGATGGAWTSNSTGIATVNSSTGVVTGVAAGTATITYTVSGTGGCANATATRTVTVTAAPNAGTLSGTQNICVAGTTTFTTSGTGGGAWTSGATGTATVNSSTGVITGVAAGTATITYTLTGTGGCANATATRTVTATAAPNAGTVSGTQNICVAGTTTFSSNGAAGGAWTSNSTGIATVNSSTGVVTGVAAGTSTITYTVTGTGGCANATATRTVTVTASPNAGTLSGTQNICVAGTTTFNTSGTAGGAWSSNNTGVATVNSSTGAINGVAVGTATITYTVTGTGGCANATATRTVTVTAAPNAGTLSGTQAICVAGTTSFSSNGNTGGAWSSNATGVATVNSSTGVVTGVAAGTATITYTVSGTGGCANATATRTVTVTAAPNTGTISGSQNICLGGAVTFTTNGTSGGSWTSSNSAVATIDGSTGAISGITAGTATITYTLNGSGGCANATSTRTITVSTPPNAGTLSGIQSICANATSNFSSNGNAGGAWSSANTAVATVNSSTGVVTGVSAGTTTITYTVTGTGGCANAIATRSVTILSAPSAPLAVAGTRCGTGVVSISATPSAGETIDWYAAASGGSVLDNGTTTFNTPSISATTIYYAQAVNISTGCISQTRTAVTATINPALTGLGASNTFTGSCGTGTTNLSASVSSVSSQVLALQNFEGSGSTMTYTTNNGNLENGNSGSGDRPASSPFFTSGSNGYGANNETATITTQNVTGLGSYSSKKVSMRLAAFSFGSTSNGMDGSDFVRVAISLDGGSTYSDEIEVDGNSNAYWAYTATGVASAVYDGNNSVTNFAPSGGGNRTADGFSTIEIHLPDNASQVRIRVTMENSSSSELWVVDDITVSGTGIQYSWVSSPAGFTSTQQNPASVAVSQTTTFTVTATNLLGCSATASTTATVQPAPAAPAALNSSRCQAGTLTISATPGAGETIDWYAAASGGSPLSGGTGTSSFTTPSISVTTIYYAQARNISSGCLSASRTAVTAAVSLPSISSVIPGNRCESGTVTMIAIPSAGASLKWYTAATGGTSIGTGNSFTTPALSATTTYFVEATSGTCVQPSRTPVNANINPVPSISITASYCTVPGAAVLTATAGLNYLWSTGQTSQIINVDQAGVYTVTGTTAAGCSATASFGVATELAANGSFSAGNTGFTTAYTFVADQAGVNNEMVPEGTYAIVSNPNTVHPSFYGADRNGNGGKIMVINGSPTAGSAVWNQNNITVLPNTTYYFSAWTMSVVNGSNAALQFSINGTQVGTVAYLLDGYTNTAGPYNWVRFYGQWNSGAATSVNLSIINMNQTAGGNDFAFDDISFGTMSPVALSVSPVINSGTSACQGSPLVLNTQAAGGASPFTYAWTGPNGFTSNQENPQVTATASSTNNGTYTLTVTDGFGCTATSNVAVSVLPLPSNQSISAASASVCTGGSTTINLASSQTGVYYQLRNNADDSPVGALLEGTGSALSLPTGVLNASTTFNVLATRFPGGCSLQMSGTVSVNQSVTPQLVVTNQTVCSGTVDLTNASVTAGSTGSGTLSYWTNAAATTALANPAAVSASGTYFIQSTNGSCSDIQAVVVSISTNPTVTFTYGAASYCSTSADPIPTLGGAAGVFTASPAGLVFANNNTGEIDLSASAAGTYTVTNTVTPTGGCSPKTATQTVTVSAAPLAAFSYSSNDFCQSANALNASPVFEAGAAAGTFSSSAGLSINATSGIINVSASTPGNYAVVNTRAAAGGCPSFADTTFLDINPYIFTGGVSASSSKDEICLNETVDLFSSGSSYATVLLRERFNGSINNWVATNTSAGGTPASAAWTLRQSPYNYNGNNHSSNDNSQFYMSNAQAQGAATTNTVLRSPVMSTVGFSTLNLDFFHYFNFQSAGDVARVQISTNNSTWTDIGSFTSDQGGRTGFVNASYNLNAYIGLPTVYIRFTYNASSGRSWSIDNVSVTGNSINYDYSWTSSPAGFTSDLQNPGAVAPVTNSYFIATATNGYGCSNPASPVPVTVNPLPADNAGADQNICGTGTVSIGAAPVAGINYSWSPSAGLSSASDANPNASPASSTAYILTQTFATTGCSSIDTVNVSVQALPSVLSSMDASRCGTGTVQLSAVSSTGTLSWFANPTGGAAIATGNSFTTPSLSATTVYYAEATSATCQAASRIPVMATISAFPVISSQNMPAATYSENQTASALTVTASVATGTLSYEWYSNNNASNTGGTLMAGSNQNTFVPPTSSVGSHYYYCVVSNNFGCSDTSAVSGLIRTVANPVVVGATPTIIAGQNNGTGYNGQTIIINGSNFPTDAAVSFAGVPAASVQFVNSNQIRAVVANTGSSVSGNLVVTNPTTGASATTSFEFIGYTTDTPNFVWTNAAAWMGDVAPAAGADVFVRHNGTITGAGSVNFNSIEVNSGNTLTLAHTGTISVVDLENDGTINWTSNGTLAIGGTLEMAASGSITPGTGTLMFNKAGDQTLFAGTATQLTFNNLILAGSGVKNLPAGATITASNLSVSAGTTLSLEDGSRLEIQKDMTVIGTLVANTATLAFTGAENSSISGNLSLYNLEINKTQNTVALAIGSDIAVTNQVNMLGGDLNLNGFQLDLGSTGNLVNETADNSVTGLTGGTIRAIRNLNAPSAVNVAGLGAVLSSAQNMGSTEVIRKHSQVIFGAGYSISRRYEIHPTNNNNLNATFVFSYFDHELSYDGLSTMEADLDLWRFNGLTWDNQNAVVDELANTLTKTSIPRFSEWTAAGMNTPLPVNVSAISVDCGGLYPSFNWTTVQERDASEFSVQQSADGKSWKEMGTVAAAGNSDRALQYSFSLKDMNSQSAYVRLVLRNTDASIQAFNPLAVSCRQSVQKEAISLYPNPNEGAFTIDLKSISEGTMTVKVINTMGVEVAQQLHNAARSNKIKMDLNGFASGIYQVLVGPEGEAPVQSFKMVIR